MTMMLRRMSSPELAPGQVHELRDLLEAAFAADEHGGFEEHDWQHALGGTHFLVQVDGHIVSHAAVVERQLHVANQPLRTGYVEAVATLPDRQRQGFGSQVVAAVNEHIRSAYELGALGTGSQPFYERLGWQIWRGPSHVLTSSAKQATPNEDGYIMVLLTPTSPAIELTEPISCEWRPGDVW